MSSPIDDIVMVEAGPSNDGPDIFDGPDDLAFVEKPRERPTLQRSKSSAKRPDKLMGLFGSFRNSRKASEVVNHPKSQGVYGDEDSNVRRKRTVAGERDGAKRIRRDDRNVGRSDKYETDAEGFMTDGIPNGDDADEVDAQREERRARRVERERAAKEARDAEIRKAEEKRAKRREAEKARVAAEKEKIREARERRIQREEEEEEARRQEDKRARRAARDDRRVREDEEAREAEARAAERRSKRREREIQVNDNVDELRPRPSKPDRRRSHMDRSVTSPAFDDEAERRLHREMRKARRTPAETEEANRRKSAMPPQDYFDPRNGTTKDDRVDFNTTAPLAADAPYINGGGKDHTSSWVESQIIEPPAPPPIEPTVMDPPPVMGTNGGYDDANADEDARRAMRRSRRHSKYVDAAPDDGEDRRRRRESRRVEKDAIRSSEGSDAGPKYSRRQSDYAGARTFDGRAANDGGAGKRSSWFKKMTNF